MCNTDPVSLGKYEKKTFFNAHHIYERQEAFKTYYATMNDVMEVAKQNPEESKLWADAQASEFYSQLARRESEGCVAGV